jgi:hypothetical protein
MAVTEWEVRLALAPHVVNGFGVLSRTPRREVDWACNTNEENRLPS